MRLFVYGTLKKGWNNHEALPIPDEIVRGEVCGQLYDPGLPALETLEEPIRHGESYGFDIECEEACDEPGEPRAIGEVLVYEDVYDALHALLAADRIESYRPGRHLPGWYERVQVRVSTPDGPVTAWTYRIEGLEGEPIREWMGGQTFYTMKGA